MKIPLARTSISVRVDAQDFSWLSQFRWELFNGGYAGRRFTKNYRPYVVLMHREITGLDSSDVRVVDHWNGDGLDNRRKNLRITTPSGNQLNRAGANHSYAGKPVTSKFRGVSFRAYPGRGGRWTAFCRIDGMRYYLGSYETEKEAAKVVSRFRKQRIVSRDNSTEVTEIYRHQRELDNREATAIKVARPSRTARKRRVAKGSRRSPYGM